MAHHLTVVDGGKRQMQNAYMKLFLSKMTMTTVMTGNVTQFSIDLAHCLFRYSDLTGKTKIPQK